LHFLIPDPCPLFPALLCFLVRMVLAAAIAELGELETAGGRLLVLGGRVIALFALSALQCDDFPHLLILHPGQGPGIQGR
jgi:hypothetical protein